MILLIHAVLASKGSKTGPIPVTYQTENETCPTSCPLKDGPCYARFHHVGRVWKRLNNGAESGAYLSWDRFLAWVGGFMPGQHWRYGVAGDLPHIGDGKTIDSEKVYALVKSNRKRKGMAYTHHDPAIGNNAAVIEHANKNGFTINLSADGLDEADKLANLGIAHVVTIMPKTDDGVAFTPAGRKVVQCPAVPVAPASQGKVANCYECKFLCWRQTRKVIIGFPPHGTAKNQAKKIMEDN